MSLADDLHELEDEIEYLGNDRESRDIKKLIALLDRMEGDNSREGLETKLNILEALVPALKMKRYEREYREQQEEEARQLELKRRQAERQAEATRQADIARRQAEQDAAAKRVREAEARQRAAQEAAKREAQEAKARQAKQAEQQRLAAEKEATRLAEQEKLEAAKVKEKRERIAAEKEAAKQAERDKLAADKAKARQDRIAADKEAAEAAQRRAKAEKERAILAEEELKLAQRRIEIEQEKTRLAEEAKAEEQRRVAALVAEKAIPQAVSQPETFDPEPTSEPTPDIQVEPYPTTGPTLKIWRTQKGFSEIQAANFLGVSRSAIYQNENREGPIGPKLLEAFQRKYGLQEQSEPPAAPNDETPAPSFQTMLGTTESSPQYGILGESGGKSIAIDLNNTHTISLFGVQGGGKSYTLGTLVEMATMPIPQLNQLPKPFATIIFHYSSTMDYAPEFTSMGETNKDAQQLKLLKERYGAEPKALSDIVLLVPADKLDERQTEYPSIEVCPLKFASSELQTSHWRFLMGAVGNPSIYIQQINRIMKQLRNNLTLEALRKAIQASPLTEAHKDLANQRLDLAADFIDDQAELGPLLRPGRLLIVDLRDEFMEKDNALGLFVVLMQLFADVTFNGDTFNKLVVFDEAHKYIKNPELVAGLVETVREMRHKGTSILVASQDPPSVPVSLIELSSQIILHKFNSPSWLKHIQKANSSLSTLTPEQMANLQAGEAYVWSSKATDESFTKGAQKVLCRPRVTQHGGATRTAVRVKGGSGG